MEAMNLTPTIAAYMAGILDGEGCVYVNKRKATGRRKTPGYGVKVCVAITDKSIVDWFQRNVELTSIYGFQPKGNRRYKWVCTWNNSAAERLLLACQPYLVIKVHQAELGLELLKHLREAPKGGTHGVVPEDVVSYREGIKKKVSNLNKRGQTPAAKSD